MELQVLEGILIRPEGDLRTAVAGLGDAVNKNEPALPEHVPVHRRPALRLGRG
ncbi:MAG: hypothetical protein KY451_11920, partial [Actinobacteria bacterium]|nr:hypothetical protein [Actinomycetota bacterium]